MNKHSIFPSSNITYHSSVIIFFRSSLSESSLQHNVRKMPQIPVDCSRKLRPKFFLIRKTGESREAVPLIAIDELPPAYGIFGVPRTLGLEETTGMLNLGYLPSSGEFYQITHQKNTSSPINETKQVPPV